MKPALETEADGELTTTSPLAPSATTALIVLSDSIEKELASTPPNLTEFTPVKLVPVMVIALPFAAEDGPKLLIASAAAWIN